MELKVYQMLRLPRKVELEVHQMLHLPRKVELEVCQMLPVPQNIIKLAVHRMVLAMKIKISNFTKYGAYCARNQRHCNGEGRPKNMHAPCQNFIPAC